MDMGFEKDMSGLEGEQKINDEHPIFVKKFLMKYQLTMQNWKSEILILLLEEKSRWSLPIN